MQESERKQFFITLTATAQMYKEALTEAVIELWWQDLAEISYEQFAQGIQKHRKDPEHGSFWPKPADILRHIHGNPEDKALRAWSKFVRAAERHGAYATPVFDDPIIHAVLSDMGGWIQRCTWELDDEPFLRNEFVRRYRGYWGEKVTPPKLIGLVERENIAAGFPPPEPVLIGDQDKALQILAGLQRQTGWKTLIDQVAEKRKELVEKGEL